MLISRPATGPAGFRKTPPVMRFRGQGRDRKAGTDRLSLGKQEIKTEKTPPSRLLKFLRGAALGGLLAASTSIAAPIMAAQEAARTSPPEGVALVADPQPASLREAPTLVYQDDIEVFDKYMRPRHFPLYDAPVQVLNELGYGNITQILVDPTCLFDQERSVDGNSIYWDPKTKIIHYPYMKDSAGIEACVDKVLESKVNSDKLKALVAGQDVVIVTTYLPYIDGGSTWHPVVYMLLSDEVKRQIPDWEEVLAEINKKGYADPDKPHSTGEEGFEEAGFGKSGGPFVYVVTDLGVRDKLAPLFRMLAEAQGKDLPLLTPEMVAGKIGGGSSG